MTMWSENWIYKHFLKMFPSGSASSRVWKQKKYSGLLNACGTMKAYAATWKDSEGRTRK